jgi:predicted amidohydrolase
MKHFSKALLFFLACSLSMPAFSHAAAGDELIPIEEVFSPDEKLYPTDKFGKVAIVQWAPSGSAPLTDSVDVAEQWKAKNRRTLETYIRDAAKNGAKMVITPEFGILGYPDIPDLPDEDDNYTKPEDIAAYAESLSGPSVQFFSRLAKELKIYIHFGYAEKSSEGFHNTVVALDPNGTVVASYRKMHLYQNEHNYLAEGKKITTYQGIFGKVGIIICSDVYGSHPMNDYANAKVNVLALSTSWAQFNTGWDYFRRGAKRVNAYLLAANQSYFPDSGVINPNGSAQSHIRQTKGIAYGFLPYVAKKKGLEKSSR